MFRYDILKTHFRFNYGIHWKCHIPKHESWIFIKKGKGVLFEPIQHSWILQDKPYLVQQHVPRKK